MEKMKAQDMRKLSRSEILEMMLLQAEEIEKLKAENDSLKEQLEDRTIAIGKAGTMAEASILINKVLLEADKAAKDYLMNIKRANGVVEPVITRPGVTDEPEIEIETKKETADTNPQPQITLGAVPVLENKEQGTVAEATQKEPQEPVSAPSANQEATEPPKENAVEQGAFEVKENVAQPQQQTAVANTAQDNGQTGNDSFAHWDEVSAKMAAFYKEHKRT